MEVRFNPDLQAKLDELAIETGRATSELVEDAVLGYFDELARAREALISRYDDLKSGRVKAIPWEQVKAELEADAKKYQATRKRRDST